MFTGGDMTHTKDEALKLALEALENTSPTGFNMERDKQFYAAITAIKQALAAPVPVEWMEMVAVNLLREGVNKHKARELAEHFYRLHPSAAQTAPCTWTKSNDPSMPDTFDATCGVVWTFTDGGPVENDVRFCPGCGGKVVEGQP